MQIENAIADVLEKAAHYIEAVETEKQAEVRAGRESTISAIREKLSAVTGEVVDDGVVDKLATVDPEILSTIEKLAEGAPSDDSLGGPSSRRSAAAPLSKDESVKVAGDRFIEFCTS